MAHCLWARSFGCLIDRRYNPTIKAALPFVNAVSDFVSFAGRDIDFPFMSLCKLEFDFDIVILISSCPAARSIFSARSSGAMLVS